MARAGARWDWLGINLDGRRRTDGVPHAGCGRWSALDGGDDPIAGWLGAHVHAVRGAVVADPHLGVARTGAEYPVAWRVRVGEREFDVETPDDDAETGLAARARAPSTGRGRCFCKNARASARPRLSRAHRLRGPAGLIKGDAPLFRPGKGVRPLFYSLSRGERIAGLERAAPSRLLPDQRTRCSTACVNASGTNAALRHALQAIVADGAGRRSNLPRRHQPRATAATARAWFAQTPA